jgi:hypothetical protein
LLNTHGQPVVFGLKGIWVVKLGPRAMGGAETVGHVCDFLLWWIFGGNLVFEEGKKCTYNLGVHDSGQSCENLRVSFYVKHFFSANEKNFLADSQLLGFRSGKIFIF